MTRSGAVQAVTRDGKEWSDGVIPGSSPTAAVFVTRWWLLRRGTLWAAAGLGLGVGLLGVIGGPLARTAVAVLAATADVLTATDALGDGAARLEHV